MMASVNMLTTQLFALGIAGLLAAYMIANVFLLDKKGKANAGYLKSFALPLALLGAYAFISGMYGEMTWPLPGSYNILFYDAYVLFGILALGAAYAFYRGIKLSYVGFYSLVAGAIGAYYGWTGYLQHMSRAPFVMFGMYGLFGLAGVLGCPIAYALDNGISARDASAAYKLVAVIAILALVGGSAIAFVLAGGALPEHLVSYASYVAH